MNYEGYNMYHPNSPQQSNYYNPSEMQFSQFSYENTNPTPTRPLNLPFSQAPYSSGSVYKGQEEDYENEPPLLEELGINFSHIIQKTSSVLLPFKESSQEVLDDTDLAGPLVFCLLFGCTLLFAGKIHFNYIYGLGVFGCVGIYLLLTLMTPRGVTPTCVVSTLGYCLLPMCLLSSIGIVMSLKSVLGVVMTMAVVFWCTVASSKLFVRTLDMQNQRILVAYPCALVYCVFALLVVF
ncbi:unnamed protein product [Trichobilharzia szidati]|nr:unnamed protein product [Trichobilharzia szidati]